jgi:hypothetical protein
MGRRRLKKWNGMIIFSRDFDDREFEGRSRQLSVYLAAYSQKDALELLESYGHPTSMYEFRGWWTPGCWGNAMEPVCPDEDDPPRRGMWIDYQDGELPRFLEPGTVRY